MNNLKRVLSLALASVMVLGMMVVSASAFDDDKIIENKTAAEVMNALGIIKGRDDGNFDPKTPVKRSEMAKMITVALTGTDKINYGLASKGSFPDVAENHWAAEYIEYCASLGIIGGRTDGKYYPDDNVTGQEAAKMMLAALGYDPEIFGFASGSKWATIVDGYASVLPKGDEDEDGEYDTISLYNGVAGQRALPLTREDAAQLIYNGLQAHTVTSKITGIQAGAPVYNYNLYDKSLLEKTFKADVNDAVTLASIKYDAKTDVYTYNESGTPIVSTIDVTEYFQQKIQTVTRGEEILAIMGTSSVAGTGYIGGAEFDAKKLTIDGKELATTEEGAIATKVYTYNSTEISGGVVKGGTEDAPTLGWKTDDGLKVWYNYDLIAEGGKITTIVVYPTSVVKVATVADGKINSYVIKAEKPEDVTATTKDELAKGDWMLVSVRNGGLPTKLEKLSVLANQTATAYSEGVYTIGGKEYELAGDASIVTEPDENGVSGLGLAYDLVIVNGYVMVADNEDAPDDSAIDLSKVLYAQQIGQIVSSGTNAMGQAIGEVLKVRVVFTNGTSDIIDVANVGVDEEGEPKPVANAVAGTEGVEAVDANLAVADTLYTFTEKDGKYSLVELTSELIASDLKLTAATLSDNKIVAGGKSGKVRFDPEATLFVKYKKSGKFTVEIMKGSDVNGWKADATVEAATELYAKTNATTGLDTVGFGVIAFAAGLPGEKANDGNYGYVVSAPINVYNPDAKVTQKQVKVWNGTETKNYFVDNSEEFEFAAGKVITYTITGDVISGVTAVGTADAVVAFDGVEIYFDSAATTAQSMDGVKVFYVDSSKKTGATPGTIKLAGKDAEEQLVNNVYPVIDEESGKLVALFVDVNNSAAALAAAEEENPCAEGHTEGDWVNTDASNHWKTCSVCSAKIDSTEEAHQEASELSWTVSGENHVKTCECGKVMATHGNGDVTDGTCTEGNCEEVAND